METSLTFAYKIQVATVIIILTTSPPKRPLYSATPILIMDPPNTNAIDTPVIAVSAK